MSQRPGFSFLACPDQEMLKRRLDTLLQTAGGNFARQVFWADADDFGSAYWQALQTVSLFATPSVLLLRRAETLGVEFWTKLSRPLSGFNEYVWPVFCLEGPQDPKKGYTPPKGLADKPYWKVAQQRGWLWTSVGLTAETMLPMLKDWAGARRLRFERGVDQELARLLPQDMTAAARELEKLELAVEGTGSSPRAPGRGERSVRHGYLRLCAGHGRRPRPGRSLAQDSRKRAGGRRRFGVRLSGSDVA